MLSILQGIEKEETKYNIDFSKDETTNMEVVEGEDGERIRRVTRKARNGDTQVTVTQQQEGQDGIPSRNILHSRKIANVGQRHVGRPSHGETREKLIEQDIVNGKQSTLHQIKKSQPTFGLNKGFLDYNILTIKRQLGCISSMIQMYFDYSLMIFY